MPDPLFLISGNQGTEKITMLNEAEYVTESVLEQMLANYPQILLADHAGPDESGDAPRWIVIATQLGVPDAATSSDLWALDMMLLDREGVPTFVELKRGRNPELRRQVVAQMLDYAANGTAYWPADRLRREFERRCAQSKPPRDPKQELDKLRGEQLSHDKYWEAVDQNLRDGRIRLLFVADRIPPELARIIMFLQTQMRYATVLGLEVPQYRDANNSLTTIAPRLINRPPSHPKGVAVSETIEMTEEEWLARLAEKRDTATAALIKQVVEDLRGIVKEVGLTDRKSSFYVMVDTPTETRYPLAIAANGDVQLTLGWLKSSPAFASEDARNELLKRVRDAGINLRGNNINGFPAFDVSEIADQDKRKRFYDVVNWVINRLNTAAG